MSQPPTAQTTKSGTSETSSPKKRGRPVGWKKPEAKDALKGNPEFMVTPEIKEKINNFSVEAAFTAEDAAFEAELNALGKDMPNISDSGPVQEVTRPKEALEHLKFHNEDYAPASTMAELQEQVHEAKSFGCDSIDGTEALVKSIFREGFEKMKATVGYGIYHDIRVYIAGSFEQNKGADKMTMEQRLFPKG